MARPPKSCVGTARACRTGVLGLVAASCRTAMRNTANPSGETMALFLITCRSASSAFHVQRRPHPSPVILPTHEQEGEGKS